ncbi:MAG: O-antigen ligase family protein [Planctomycetes bacterium]|nr:O-antigen ligase family protein [Planctomycetota bacterium]
METETAGHWSSDSVEPTEKTSIFVVLFLAPFIIGAISVAMLTGYNYLVVGLGGLCAAGYVISSIRSGFTFPKELLLFWAYFMWSILGIINAISPALFYAKLFTLFQFAVMILLLAHFSSSIANVRMLFWAVLIGAAIIAVSAYVTGEYQRSETSVGETGRTAGLALNSNSFAMTLVYAAAILLFFFRTWKSWFLKGGIIIVMLIMARLVVASGSRKGFITFFMLLFAWFFLSYRKELFRRPLAFMAALIVIVGIVAYLYVAASGTLMEYRLEKAAEGTGGSVSARKMMIKQGLGLIRSHPFVGVGLDHFRVHSGFETYSHNNYIEVTTGSGIPGGVLYYLIFVVLLLRLRRLNKLQLDHHSRELLNMALAFLFVQLVVDLVLVSFTTKMSWIITAVLIGWSYHKENQLMPAAGLEADYSLDESDYADAEADAYEQYDVATY